MRSTNEPPSRRHRIRVAKPTDCAAIAGLIRELAVYEKLESEVEATAGALERHLFGSRPVAEALIAELDGSAVGFALFFHSFSTFRCKPSLYLEDLFVRPEYRGRGIGRDLFTSCARLAVERDCGRFEWAVLDWNEPAIGFYRSMGARAMTDWTVNRLDDDLLHAAAAGAPLLERETIDG
ncbi:MAG: GNAT family N-acetyltransferase [Isosphaeraceae bacterium]|nr:GNAT family N-acetyltransferase [Isosphaeraceae bacterium]